MSRSNNSRRGRKRYRNNRELWSKRPFYNGWCKCSDNKRRCNRAERRVVTKEEIKQAVSNYIETLPIWRMCAFDAARAVENFVENYYESEA